MQILIILNRIELIDDRQRIKTFSLKDNGGTKTHKPDSDLRALASVVVRTMQKKKNQSEKKKQ